MDEEHLEKYLEKSVKHGYSKKELENVLNSEGFSEEQIEEALDQVDESKLGQSLGNPITGLDLEDEEYYLIHDLIKNNYRVLSSEEELILKASNKIIGGRDSFTLKDEEGKDIFKLDTEEGLDFPGDYILKDCDSGEAFAVLEKDFSPAKHSWKVKTTEGDHVASIKGQSSGSDFLRSFSRLFSVFPYSFAVENPEGTDLGEVKTGFGRKDEASIRIEKSGDFPREALIASVIAVGVLD